MNSGPSTKYQPNHWDKWSFMKYKDCSIVLFSYKQEKTFVIYTLLKLRIGTNILIILESVSLLGFFSASCDLIKNSPILVAIILRLIKLCLWLYLYPGFYCYCFEFILFRNPKFPILLSFLFGFISSSLWRMVPKMINV